MDSIIQEKIRQHKVETGMAGYVMRLEYLTDRIHDLDEEIFDRLHRWEKSSIPEQQIFFAKLNKIRLKGLAAEHQKRKREALYVSEVMLQMLDGRENKAPTRGVTDDEIERARSYPIENLLDIKRGVAHCISGTHRDNNPSMDTKNNFCYCYACQWSGDAIDVYIKLHGASFIDAVKALQ